jgi:hypothetical protein
MEKKLINIFLVAPNDMNSGVKQLVYADDEESARQAASNSINILSVDKNVQLNPVYEKQFSICEKINVIKLKDRGSLVDFTYNNIEYHGCPKNIVKPYGFCACTSCRVKALRKQRNNI